jgi:TRAP-type C4-dicarboxylate transport system permease small subunit
MPLRKIQGSIAILVAINRVIATVLFTLLTGVVALQVLTRFVLHAPIIWSEEVARFLFFWVVLLGAAMSVKDRRHFVIDVTGGRTSGARLRQGSGEVTPKRFARRRRPTLRFLLDIVPGVCVLAFSLLLLAEGVGYAQVGLFRTASNSRVNMALVYAAIPTFAALSVIYSAANLLLDWAAFREGRGPTPRPPQIAD